MEGGGKIIMKPYECPVCHGRGTVPNEFYNPPMTHEYRPTSTIPMRETCRACSGKGILWGSDFSIDVQAPDPTIYGDGNTTFPPFTITWENPMNLDNLPPNDDGTIAMNRSVV